MLKLTKNDRVKYISHRDFVRAFELALRRARLPLAYSEGFNPRPKMSFGLALGVGVTSDDEKILLSLAQQEDLSVIQEKLNANLPSDIRVTDAEEIPEGIKSPISAINASLFQITVACDADCASELQDAIIGMLKSEKISVTRIRDGRTKESDIRPSLKEASVKSFQDGDATIEIVLRIGESGGAGPQDFVQALKGLMPNLKVKSIHRTKQFPD